MPKIKLCGLSRIEDIKEANKLTPEYIGFVFYKKSKRNVSFETAHVLKQYLLPEIKAVGVFVDEEIPFIKKLADKRIIDMIQLHGHEDNNYLAALKKEVGLPIIKAIQIDGEKSFTEKSKICADYYLLDSGMGTGNTFDWRLAERFINSTSKGVFLAGGLDPDNVTQAINMLHPFAVDVSSGIETDGFKDFEKMRRFVKAARRNEDD